MSDRTFFVRLNLDDMLSEVIGLDSSEERSQWLEGFMVGASGKESRDSWPSPKIEGHRFGAKCFYEAQAFRAKQSEKGYASAEARRNRKVTEIEPEANCGSTAVEPEVNQTSTYPTSNIHNPITISEKPKRTRQAAFTPPTLEEVREHAAKIGVVDPDKFFHYHASRGWIVGKAPMKSWTHAMQTWLSNQHKFAPTMTPAVPQLPLKPEPDYANDPRYRPAWAV